MKSISALLQEHYLVEGSDERVSRSDPGIGNDCPVREAVSELTHFEECPPSETNVECNADSAVHPNRYLIRRPIDTKLVVFLVEEVTIDWTGKSDLEQESKRTDVPLYSPCVR